MGPRTFLTVQEFVWYNCSAVDGSSARQFYGGINGDLLQEGVCHRLHVPGLLQPEPLPLQRPLLTRASAGDTQTLKGSVSVGSLGPGAHKVLFELSSQGLRQKMAAILDTFDSNQFMLCPWTMSFFQKLYPSPFPSVTE